MTPPSLPVAAPCARRTISSQEPTTVATRLEFAASPAQIWDALMFYEQIDERSPLLLRLLLPVPVRVEGRRSELGDEARCVYETGYLVKRLTQIDRERRYAFTVVEQNLTLAGGLSLVDGWYALRALPGGRTEVETGTRYLSRNRPGWLWRPAETAVCQMFHRHILRAMERGVGRDAR